MSMNKLQIPDGVRDYTGRHAYAKRDIEHKLRGLLRTAGFEEVETPVFEYDSIFLGEIGNTRQENMLRFFDIDGKALALRPDFTMPAARLVTARASEFKPPIRIFYIGDAFGFQYDYGLRQRQFTQVGAELMGGGSVMADAEILMLAAHSIEVLGINDYVLDMGHVGIFAGLVQRAGLDDENAEHLRQCIDGKVLPELEKALDGLGLDAELSHAFRSLPNMYGPPEVLDEAARIFKFEECGQAIDEARQIISMLKGDSLGSGLTIDLGLLPDMNYYTGMVFRGMVPGIGYQLLSGGRYDNVLGQFGRPMPATGFAMGINWALEAVEKQCGLGDIPPASAIVGAVSCCQQQANAYAWEQRRQGIAVLNSYAGDAEALKAEAAARGIAKAVFFDEDGMQAMDVGEGRLCF